MTYNIISTGSKGNAVVLNSCVMIDCGVPFKSLRNCYKNLQIVLLTHIHSDHFNKSTIKRLANERPALRFACGEWLVPELEKIVDTTQIDVLACGKWYNYGILKLSPVELFHEVPNCGYRLDFGNDLNFYATDTGTLGNIIAKNYNLYMVEANHIQAEIEQRVKEKTERGEFAYEINAAKNHLSKEQTDNWLCENMGVNSRYVYLHQHKEAEKVES